MLREAFETALLAEAAYVVFPSRRPTLRASSPLFSRSDIRGTLFDFLEKSYEVVDHQEDTLTGFSATVWRTIGEQQKFILSIRGTEPGYKDPYEDIRYIVHEGYARRQLVDLYNYYRRLIVPDSQLAVQVRLIDDSGSGLGFAIATAAPEKGFLVDVPEALKSVIEVTGHSLGGHLAFGFSRFFPDKVSSVATFNAAGYSESASSSAFFRALGGVASFPESYVTNFDGREGPLGLNLISNALGRPKPGGRKFVFIEDQFETLVLPSMPELSLNHAVSLHTNSLALYSLFERIDPNVTLERVTRLLEGASNRSPFSLESALDGLRALFRIEGWQTTTPTQVREAYFDNFFLLDGLVAGSYSAGAGRVLAIGDLGQNELQVRARTGLEAASYRHALQALVPFVVERADPMPGYSTDMDAFSSIWIDRRAELLVRLIDRNEKDRTGQLIRDEFASDPVDYRWATNDGKSNLMRFVSGPSFTQADSRIRQVAFGSDRNDSLKGSIKADHLFGESGNDNLTGLAGTDYIEGGAGNDEINGGRGDDTLIGGDGFDTYVYKPGDGQDRIIDSDRKGRIVLDTDTGRIALGNWVADGSSPNTWRSASGLATLTHNSPWTVTFADGGSIVLGDMLEADDFGFTLDTADDFADGYVTVTYLDEEIAMAIEDDAERQAALLARLSGIAGDTRYLGGPDADFWNDFAGSNLVELAEGDDTARLGAEDDIVAGGEGVDAILGGAGDDHLFAADVVSLEDVLASDEEAGGEPGDMLADIAGDDWLIGDLGDDLISGGDGNDLLVGAAGDDHIYGDDYFPMAVADANGNPVSWSFDEEIERQHTPHGEILESIYRDTGHGGNDEIHGGAGDDWIHAGSGDDVVYGDAGDDYLVGGAGSDAVFGGGGDDWLIADGIADFSPRDEQDYLDGGDGNDLIAGNEGDNVIFGGAGDDEILSGGGNDIIDGGEGNDTITADSGEESAAWASIVHGGAGDDDITASGELYGDDGNDMVAGAAPGDELYGGAGNDLLISGGADSRFDGGEGDDVYSLGLEAGRSTISDASGNDTIELASFDLSDDPDRETIADSSLRLTVENDRFVLHYGELGDSVEFLDDAITIERVRIVHEFEAGDVRVSEILLSSLSIEGGSSAESDVIRAGNAASISTHAGDGDDIVYGTSGDDVLAGEGGDDALIGGAGSDTYRFARGGGHDRIVDTGSSAGDIDSVVFDSMAPTDVSVFSTEGFLLLQLADDGGDLLVDWDPGSDTGIERVVFAGDVAWGREDLLARSQMLVIDSPLEAEPDPPADTGAGSPGASTGGGASGSDGTGGGASATQVADNDSDPPEVSVSLDFADAMPDMPALSTAEPASAPIQPVRRASQQASRALAPTEDGVALAIQAEAAGAAVPIESFFNRVTPPPLPQQSWLDNWMPSGARGAAVRTEPSASPIGPQAPADGQSGVPTPAASPAIGESPVESTRNEDGDAHPVARRYADIDAWFAADDDGDPDDRLVAGGVAAPFAASGDLFWSSIASSDPGLNLRIASAGISELAGAFRPLRGLDEGFARLV